MTINTTAPGFHSPRFGAVQFSLAANASSYSSREMLLEKVALFKLTGEDIAKYHDLADPDFPDVVKISLTETELTESGYNYKLTLKNVAHNPIVYETHPMKQYELTPDKLILMKRLIDDSIAPGTTLAPDNGRIVFAHEILRRLVEKAFKDFTLSGNIGKILGPSITELYAQKPEEAS